MKLRSKYASPRTLTAACSATLAALGLFLLPARPASSQPPPGGPPPPPPGDHAPPIDFREADANSDGFVTKEEFAAYANKLFEKMDKQGTGKLTPPDFRYFAPPGRPPGPGPRGPRPEGMMRSKDQPPPPGESTGVTPKAPPPEERSQPKDQPSPPGEQTGVTPKAPPPEDRMRQKGEAEVFGQELEISQLIFQKLDKNADGKIDKNEAPSQLAGFFDQLDSNHDGVLSAEDAGMIKRIREKGLGRDRARARFMEMDTNGDGKLERNECPPPLARRFDELDKNSDGSLDPEELKEGVGPGRPGAPAKKGVAPPTPADGSATPAAAPARPGKPGKPATKPGKFGLRKQPPPPGNPPPPPAEGQPSPPDNSGNPAPPPDAAPKPADSDVK